MAAALIHSNGAVSGATLEQIHNSADDSEQSVDAEVDPKADGFLKILSLDL